jgi:hypothetical protein
LYAGFCTKLTTRRVGPLSPQIRELLAGKLPEYGYGGSESEYLAYELSGNGTPPTDRHVLNARRKLKDVFRHGIPVEAIAHSSCSESMYKGYDPAKDFTSDIQEAYDLLLVNVVRDHVVPRPKGTD